MKNNEFWKLAKKNEHKYVQWLKDIGCNIPTVSGIYWFIRVDNGLRYAYVGQAKNLQERIWEHYCFAYDAAAYPHQRIDGSLKKRKNWQLFWNAIPYEALDVEEQYMIKSLGNDHQLYNKNLGGSNGSYSINDEILNNNFKRRDIYYNKGKDEILELLFRLQIDWKCVEALIIKKNIKGRNAYKKIKELLAEYGSKF